MTDNWTHSGAYVAAFVLLLAGLAALFLGHGWPAVVACALAVLLLVAFRAAEHRADVRDALDARGRLVGLEADLARLAKAHDETARNAEAALVAARHRAASKPGY